MKKIPEEIKNELDLGEDCKIVVVGDVEYALQHPGYDWYLKTSDRATMSNGQIAKSVMFEAYLNDVVVYPKGLKVNDFRKVKGKLGSLGELMEKCDSFLAG